MPGPEVDRPGHVEVPPHQKERKQLRNMVSCVDYPLPNILVLDSLLYLYDFDHTHCGTYQLKFLNHIL